MLGKVPYFLGGTQDLYFVHRLQLAASSTRRELHEDPVELKLE